jgi:ABC-type multidrug transport system ATPase subunit
VIRARGLTKSYGDERVLDGLDLDVEAGRRVALLGPNGAGKTTLFRCLLGIVGFGGRVDVDGHPVSGDGKAARGRIGYVPQAAPAYQMTLADFVAFFAGLRGIQEGRVESRLNELDLSLPEAGDKSLRELSGGMLQKAVLALALASGAPVLLLDEPTASLDPGSRREFLRAVRDVETDRTLVFASHRFDEIESLAHRVLVLHRGRLVFDGSPEELGERAGLGAIVWLRVEPGTEARTARELGDLPAVRAVRGDGAGLEAEVEPGAVLDVLSAVRDRGMPVREVRTQPPSPDEMMARVLGGEVTE